jgi:hypothetical protein
MELYKLLFFTADYSVFDKEKNESINIEVYLPDAPPLLAISQCG